MKHILFGIYSIEAALKTSAESVLGLYIDEKKSQQKNIIQLQTLAKDLHIPIEFVARQTLDKLSQQARHQSVVAQIKKFNPKAEKELIKHLSGIKNSLVLVLDNIQDPRNFGACLRSAAASNVDAVVFGHSSSSSVTALVHHTSAGSSYYLNLFQVNNLARSIEALKKINIWCYGLDSNAKQNIYQTDLTGSTAIIMGAEGKGLKPRTRSLCDNMLCIPMNDTVESLNISVAAAVSLFEVNRQRM